MHTAVGYASNAEHKLRIINIRNYVHYYVHYEYNFFFLNDQY